MKLLKDKITKEGTVLKGGILKVDGFINQQVDPILMDQIANEFVEYFKNEQIDKVVTIEASGISPSIFVAHKLGVPLLVLKKGKSVTLTDVYQSNVYSYTKQTSYTVSCNKKNLQGERCLFIDDFLANGQAFLGVLDILKQSNSSLVGVGIVIEKSFQKGRKIIKDHQINICSLARIKSLENEKIQYVE